VGAPGDAGAAGVAGAGVGGAGAGGSGFAALRLGFGPTCAEIFLVFGLNPSLE